MFIHWIDRDLDERFVVIVDDTRASAADYIEIFGLDGTQYTVAYADTDARDYIAATSIAQNLKTKAITIADATFFLNNQVATALTGTAAGYSYETGFTPADNKSWADFDSPPSASGLYFFATTDYAAHPAGTYISQNHAGDPPYYARVATDAADSEIDATTMPVRMDFDGVSTFSVDLVDWNDRLSGDSDTNPGPSFIGSTLAEITFHRNRFWFGSSEQIVSSQAGDLFNLWVDNYANVTDSDPVDQQLSGSSVNNITHMLGFNKALVIFTDGIQQYEVRSETVLTPSSVNVIPSTAYKVADIRPVTLGNQLYFVTDQSKYTSIWEYYYDYEAANTAATLVTAHVQGYIPPNVTLIKSSANNDMLFVFSEDEPNVLYVYQMFWAGDQKVQDAWSRWVFDDSCEILSFHVFDNELYLLLRYTDKLYLEKMYVVSPPVEEGMPYEPKMDRRELVSGTYSATTQRTSFTLSYKDTTIDEVVLGPDWGDRAGIRVPVVTNDSSGASTILYCNGKLDDEDVYAGRNYTFKITLSEQHVKDQEGVVMEGNLQLRNVTVYHRDSGTYTVRITPYGRSAHNRVFVPSILGKGTTLLGQVLIEEEGEYYTKVLASAQDTTIEILNDSPLPCTITGAEFIATFIQARRNPAK